MPEVADPRLLKTSTRHGDAVLRRLPAPVPGRKVVGAEVGVCRGVMSAHLLGNRADLVLHLVDGWCANKPGSAAWKWGEGHNQFCNTQTPKQVEDNYQATLRVLGKYADRSEVHRGRSVPVARTFADRSLDFVFIDADHRYESVVADITAWLSKVRPGGWIGGHDYGLPELDGAVNRAADEFATRSGLDLELDDFFTWFVRLPGPEGGHP